MKKLVCYLVVIIFCFACTNDQTDDSSQVCEDVVCTLNFVTLDISVKNRDGEPVILENFEVIIIETNENITLSDVIDDDGIFPIVNDSSFQPGMRREIALRFTGFVNGNSVVTEDILIATDCCHVSLISGNTEVTINQ